MAPRPGKRGEFCIGSIRLVADPASDNVRSDIETKSGIEPRWIQIAAEGEFQGHKAGDFQLGEKEFGEIVTNFRDHPSFLAGSDGTGTARVIAYDFGHASEQPPNMTAVHGAPAQAWALDVETRPDESGLQLWALTEFLEPAGGYVRDGKYAWTSIAIWPDAEHPVTGKSIGWYMSSIALTNDPFIQGMVPIAARRRDLMLIDMFDPPTEPQAMLNVIKQMFELAPDAPLAEVMGKLAELRGMTTAGATPPPGVDTETTLSHLRQLLRLPALATADEVFAELDKLTAAISQALPPEPPPPVPPPPSPAAVPPPPVDPSTQATRNDMSLVKLLAGRLNIPADEKEVSAAIMLALEEGTEAKTMLEKLMEALGKKPLEKARELLALKDLIPHIEQLLGGQLEGENASVEEDVDAVTAAYNLPSEARAAIVLQRKGSVTELALDGCMKVVDGKTPLQLRAEARKAFAANYPLAFAKPGEPTHLTHSFATRTAAEPSSAILRAIGPTASGGVSFGAARGGPPALPAAAPGNGRTEIADIAVAVDGYPGRNEIEKAMAFIRDQPGGKAKHFDLVTSEAFALTRNIKTALAS